MRRETIIAALVMSCLLLAAFGFANVADNDQDNKDMIYRAKDLMYQNSYEQAFKLFQKVFQDKASKYRAEALYYSARCLAKLERFPKAKENLARLGNLFPKSSWRDDALALRASINAAMKRGGDVEGIIAEDLQEVQIALEINEQELARIGQRVERANQVIERVEQAERVSEMAHPAYPGQRTKYDEVDCDDEDGLKEAALNALMHMDNEARALEIARKFVASEPCERLLDQALLVISQNDSREAFNTILGYVKNSKNPQLKSKALFWLGQYDTEEAYQALIQAYDSIKDYDSRRNILFAISERDDIKSTKKLVQIVKTEPSMKLRKHAIHMLMESDHEGLVVKELMNIYKASDNNEIKGKISMALGEIDTLEANELLRGMALTEKDPKLREDIIWALGDSENKGAIDFLADIYRKEKDPKVKRKIVFAIANSDDEVKALDYLHQFYNESDDVELKKKLAIGFVEFDNDRAVEILIELIKKEKNHELKKRLLFHLGQMDSEKAEQHLIEMIEKDLGQK